MANRSILIIKLGYCETLVNEDGFVPSLGDVFRHTVLLHRYRDDHVTWITSESAIPLLKGNPYIAELVTYTPATVSRMAGREFDEILCIEKAPSICAMAMSIKARKRFGFGHTGDRVSAHRFSQPALDIANGKDPYVPIQSLLYQMVGDYWQGEDYVLGYKPSRSSEFEVALNYRVGSKWPTKAWPDSSWEQLAGLLHKDGISFSWQEGESDLARYMDWINAGRAVVTCDSLGMHLGLALHKRVVALFGPTPSDNIYMYGRGVIIRATEACSTAGCMRATCEHNTVCMSEIRPETVFRIVKNQLGRGLRPATVVKLTPVSQPMALISHGG